jgi:hypothetical protein
MVEAAEFHLSLFLAAIVAVLLRIMISFLGLTTSLRISPHSVFPVFEVRISRARAGRDH